MTSGDSAGQAGGPLPGRGEPWRPVAADTRYACFLDSGVGHIIPVMLVRGVDVMHPDAGARVAMYYGFGPAGAPYPAGYRVRIIDTVTQTEPTDRYVAVRTFTDGFGVRRFAAATCVEQNNN